MSTARSSRTPSPLPEDLTGSTVGRFQIQSRLGAGGMGEVYRAEDTTLRRRVALKRIARSLGTDPEASRRILREAQRASTLSSEHIASVHDVIEVQGELFIVMEYVEGETLRHRLRRPLTLQQFFAIATQCAEGLLAAQEGGIVHCDFKPENIMLTPSGVVKILDFGLAKHLPRSDQSSTLHATRTLAGTPAYMAPEVLLGNAPDSRSDIFSLGVVLYEMLTLRHPFFSKSGLVATSDRILHQAPTAIRTLNPAVPEVLETIVMKAVAKEPLQRYANAREVLNDLDQVRSGSAPTIQFPAAPQPTGKKSRYWLLSLTALVVLAGAFAAYHWRARRPILTERGWVLVSDFDTSGDNRIPDTGVREGLTIALQQSRYVNVFPRSRAYEVLQRMETKGVTRIDETLGREICRRENLQVLLTGSIERMGQAFQITVRGINPVQGGLLFAEKEQFNGEDQFFNKADSLTTRIRKDLGESLEGIGKSNRPLAKVTTPSLEALQLYSQAVDAGDQGKSEQIPELLNGALRVDPNFAMAHLRLGQYYLEVVGKNEKAAAELKRAYELRQHVTDREQRRIEAGYYSLQEQYDDEVQSLSVLVNLYPDDEEAHRELAGAYYDLHQLDKAISELREVLRLNPSAAPAYRSLVLYLAFSNQPDAAIAASRDAVQHGVDPPRMHWGLGLAYLALGDVSTARTEFEKIGQETETDRQLQGLCSAVADLYQGQLNTAKDKLADETRWLPSKTGGLQTFQHYLLGRIYLRQGKSHDAAQEADLILATPRTGLQVSDLLNAGILYVRAGRSHKALLVLHRIDKAQKEFPSSSNRSSFSALAGEIQLAHARPVEAGRSFSTAIQEYSRVISHIGLARAYQSQRQWELAAQEWQQVLGDQGEVLHNEFPADLAIGRLELGLLYRLLKRPDFARTQYEAMLRMWAESDDTPVLQIAQGELQELKAGKQPGERVLEERLLRVINPH